MDRSTWDSGGQCAPEAGESWPGDGDCKARLESEQDTPCGYEDSGPRLTLKGQSWG